MPCSYSKALYSYCAIASHFCINFLLLILVHAVRQDYIYRANVTYYHANILTHLTSGRIMIPYTILLNTGNIADYFFSTSDHDSADYSFVELAVIANGGSFKFASGGFIDPSHLRTHRRGRFLVRLFNDTAYGRSLLIKDSIIVDWTMNTPMLLQYRFIVKMRVFDSTKSLVEPNLFHGAVTVSPSGKAKQ